MKATGDNVIVRPIEAETESKGGILLLPSSRPKPQEGVVVSAGPGRINQRGKRTPMTLCAGDRVLYGKYSGTDVSIGSDRFVILREDEVLGTVYE